jgi:hypothetical protein
MSDLVVGPQARHRRDHDACRARIHDAARQRPHGRIAGRRHPDYDGSGSGPLDHAAGDVERLLRLQLGRLAHDAQHRDPGAAGLQIEVVIRSMEAVSMRPSSWNGVGAMANVPDVLGESFMSSPVATR